MKESYRFSKEIEIPEGYEAKIVGNKVVFVTKESEDERIRNAISYAICAAAHQDGTLINDVTKDEALAYLEKQDEQKPAEINEYEIIKKHITGDALSGEVNKRLKECGWYVTDDKPAEWSEKEKMHLYNAIEAVKYVYDISEGTSGFKCVKFLKSLRPQPHWKPSEEQMRAVFDASERNDKLGFVLLTLYNDLKKL